MNQNLIVLLTSWGILGLIVLVLAAYRSQLSRKEDDHIHMSDFDSGVVAQQAAVSNRIDAVERWGKTLTVVLVVYGVALAAYYMYTLWQAQSSTVIMQ